MTGFKKFQSKKKQKQKSIFGLRLETSLFCTKLLYFDNFLGAEFKYSNRCLKSQSKTIPKMYFWSTI